MKTTEFFPSKYQQAIFDWIINCQGDAIVTAVAGSGKSTTLVKAAELVSTSSSLFLAFNQHVVQYLRQWVSGMEVRTIHSIGSGCLWRALGKTQLDGQKYHHLSKYHAQKMAEIKRKAWTQSQPEKHPIPTPEQIQATLKKLVELCQYTLINPQDRQAMEGMIEHFGIEVDDDLDLALSAILAILDEGEELAKYQKVISYSDMLYLPHIWGLQPPRYDWVFVDECQDLNPAQLDLVLKCKSKNGRALFCGDDRQAIMGFTGADCDSVQHIKEHTQAVELPLSICYRCPRKHLELARNIVPQIEAADDAVDGIVETIKSDQLSCKVKPGDLIISRTTSPLIKTCLELITHRIPARVRGRDLGNALTSIVRDVSAIDGFTFRRFSDHLHLYEQAKIVKYVKKSNAESLIESLQDRLECIRICYEAFNCKNIDQLCDEIENLFSDNRPTVMLSTIHRAKGLEENRVFILNPSQMPMKWGNQKLWELRQEMNLKYVALTRSREALYFVEG
jgi:superfamily I DNA/RNA helicase